MMTGLSDTMTGDEMMEVDVKDAGVVEDSLQYQPQADLQQHTETLTELKPVKQSVTYDSSTGKMYAELGSTASERHLPSNNPENNNQFSFPQQQTSYPPPAAQTVYSGYPVMSPAPQYSTNYTSAPAPLAPPPYSDRNVNYSFTGGSSAPGAFLPHSAINLSVKTEESPLTGQPQTSSDPSPQILDLTRPLR